MSGKESIRDKENLHPGEDNGTENKQGRPGSMELYTDIAERVAVEDSSMRMEENLVSVGIRQRGLLKNGDLNILARRKRGFFRGIWLLWDLAELIVDVRIIHEQFIHCKVSLGGEEMLFTAIYASPTEQKRHRLWEILHEMACLINEPWILVGDFNDIKTPLEQKGGGRINESRCRRFNEWIEECRLIDIDAQGPFFTWKG
ncbi:hypothetical protein K1719_047329 [Acacia pycnantha]|nr:hypothetical protein K1719_047329 [Acacia pycnantha]